MSRCKYHRTAAPSFEENYRPMPIYEFWNTTVLFLVGENINNTNLSKNETAHKFYRNSSGMRSAILAVATQITVSEAP